MNQRPNFPPEENFVAGVIMQELALATTWNDVVRASHALNNVRQMAHQMRAEHMHLNRPVQNVVPQEEVARQRQKVLDHAANYGMHQSNLRPQEIAPDYDSVPGVQLPWEPEV